MIFNNNQNNGPSLEDKIDYIYNEMRGRKRNRILGLIIKLALIGLIIYFYVSIVPNLDKDQIVQDLTKSISETITPFVKSLVEETLKGGNITPSPKQ